MGARDRVRIPFGEGVDRSQGGLTTQPASFRDLLNVVLRGGAAALRGGLYRRTLFAGATTVVGVQSLRSQGVGVVVTYDAGSGDCDAWLVQGAGLVATPIGTLFTVPAGATTPPRISMADSYDRMFIAHDEPIHAFRPVTQVYDFNAA
jgi:hypothetical protein